MTYRTELKVRFGDEDHAGIVYYPRFFDFFHQAFEDFFGDHGHPYKEVLDVDKAGWPAVHAEADFKQPLRFGDVLAVELDVERLGNSSASFLYTGRRKADGGLVVIGRVTVVCIHMDTFQSRPIPDTYRALFEQHTVVPKPQS